MLDIANTDPAEGGPDYAPIVSDPDHSKWLAPLPGEKLAFRVRNEQVDGRYSIMENVAEPGIGSPLHVHTEDEVFYVIAGTMTFSLAGHVREASAGSVVVIPAGTAHAWKNRSSTSARMLVIFTPGGIEPFFEKLGTVAPQDIPEFAARFGTTVVGPPLD